MAAGIDGIIERLSPLERKIIPYLKSDIEIIKKKTGLDETSVVRALRFLSGKGIIEIMENSKTLVDLGTNGIYYKKNHLPERRLIMVLEESNHLTLEEAKKLSKLSENEFKVSLGVLKDKAFINLSNGKLSLTASKEEIIKKSFEEQLLEMLPCEYESLAPEMLHAVEKLKRRKEIIEVRKEKKIAWQLTPLGKSLEGQKIDLGLIEEVTPEVIKTWSRGKKFRKYDIQAPVPRIYAGKKHFVNQAIEQAKRIWLDLGFKEMSGPLVETSFWVFDALFTPQDHQAREMQDTFFIKGKKGKLPEETIVNSVKKSHESGVLGSKGWQYNWKEEEAKKVLLRTHTTCLSVKTLASLRNAKNKTGKYFSVGKCFRNETLDWNHGFEFNQTDGIVICKGANFRNLLGYLKEFFMKMGFSEIKFVPSFFAYTEPSVEIYGYHKGNKTWIEIGGAGMFRPEVVVPLLGEYIPVLAWGPGFDRIIMDQYDIKDLREMYENDIQKLRNKRVWMK
ncbi:MAG TPA: phenylalanine--tRNA ligase subunit alpha [Candidatus Nanoarchaeia archaeon]|nr:phenylalanine--tRNA ligase subunit alpha [Candidatus Nanoarchaeia archaeon]